jgi:hypothetical protein
MAILLTFVRYTRILAGSSAVLALLAALLLIGDAPEWTAVIPGLGAVYLGAIGMQRGFDHRSSHALAAVSLVAATMTTIFAAMSVAGAF